MTKTITKEMPIGDILETCPEAAGILLSFGVHCVGCRVSAFESLEEGFHGHGLGDAEVDEAVAKINAQLEKNSSETEDVLSEEAKLTVTDAAAKKLQEMFTEHKKEALRLEVQPGGCSGFRYGLDLVDLETKKENDLVIEDNGVKILIDKESLARINGAEIDYLDTLQGAGFKISNPNAKDTCGCGDSFN